jgi:anti-anti-sigma factor
MYAPAAHGKRLILDLCDVDYISSVGLRLLMLAQKDAVATGGTVELVVCSPVILEILEITRHTMIFRIWRSRAQAIQALA